MVCRPVALVETIGIVETLDDAVDAGPPIDGERNRSTGGPRLQIELTEIADVIRVKVGEKYRADRRQWNAQRTRFSTDSGPASMT